MYWFHAHPCLLHALRPEASADFHFSAWISCGVRCAAGAGSAAVRCLAAGCLLALPGFAVCFLSCLAFAAPLLLLLLLLLRLSLLALLLPPLSLCPFLIWRRVSTIGI